MKFRQALDNLEYANGFRQSKGDFETKAIEIYKFLKNLEIKENVMDNLE